MQVQGGDLRVPPSMCVPCASHASALLYLLSRGTLCLAHFEEVTQAIESLSFGRHQKVADESVMGPRDLLGNGLGKRVGRKPKNDTDQTITLSALQISGMRMT